MFLCYVQLYVSLRSLKQTCLFLQTPHDTAIVTLDPSGSEELIHVHCSEAQSIGDLMMKYGLRCSSLWSSDVAIAPNAPCVALCEHKMSLVVIKTTPCQETWLTRGGKIIPRVKTRVDDEEIRGYYHNMSWFKLTSLDNDVQRNIGNQEPTVILYYHNKLERLDETLYNDGRFDSQDLAHADENASVAMSNESDDETEQECIANKRVVDIEGSEVSIVRSSCENTCSEELYSRESGDHVFGCVICYNVATYYLDCGHLYCDSCTRELKSNETTSCSLCRREFREFKYIFRTHTETTIIEFGHVTSMDFLDPNDLIVMTCHICNKLKRWITDCSHLSCACYTRRCIVCNKGPIRKWTKLHLRL